MYGSMIFLECCITIDELGSQEQDIMFSFLETCKIFLTGRECTLLLNLILQNGSFTVLCNS